MTQILIVCIRCEDNIAVTEWHLCSGCHWAVRAEIEEGFYELRQYLKAWSAYEAWCAEHRVAT